MRTIININQDWSFSKDEKDFVSINLPHTWNEKDGTDGGNDYYRGKCHYQKKFSFQKVENEEVYLEFQGANQSCEAYLNQHYLGKHLGGYSTFRFEITSFLEKENVIDAYVNNEACGNIYPQQADFTFYGGIYRDVNLIRVPKAHFDLDYFGGPGIKVTSKIENNEAKIFVEAYTKNADEENVSFSLGKETIIVPVKENKANCEFIISNPHLWNGIEDPYLYKISVSLKEDRIETNYGIRSYKMDPDQGFFLNDKHYPLHGVARHQDRAGKGSAISKEDHLEDLDLIMEMGANAIRLAHYQHDQFFYDECDKRGIIVWAEIPYISEHLRNGEENTLSQMKELIIQNYNHPCIVCWGLSNEICISNDENLARLENHKKLNELCHSLDKSRPTAMAHIGKFDMDHNPLFQIPDIHGVNIYYGWYEKKVEDAKEYFDSRHQKHPNACLSITEYGADCNPKFCGLTGERGDYSENYQCYYHEKMLEIIEERPYLWASFVWNMFDFGADGRNEGDKPGQNQKGLVTFDRQYKKDAYYLYQAHWSKKPMLHICNKHYVDRVESKTQVIVYSNLNRVDLFQDGKLIEGKDGEFKFVFDFDISGAHHIQAKAGGLIDEMDIQKVDTPNQEYHLDDRSIINWLSFIDKEKPGYCSLDTRVSILLENPEARRYILDSLKEFGMTYERLTGDNPRSPGSTMADIPVKFVLRMCRGLTPEKFNSFAEGLIKIKL